MKNNKGFTLVEMLVSFTLSMVLIIVLFQLIINLKDIYMSSGSKTELLNKQYLMTNKIYMDLNEKKVSRIDNCNNSIVCIEFVFLDGSTKKLEADLTEKKLKYDGFIIELNNDTYFETININTTVTQSNRNIFNISIPIYNKSQEKTNFGINIVYPYNNLEVTNNYGDKYLAIEESELEVLPYVQTNGNQYVDLNYAAKTNTEIRLDIEFIANENTNQSNMFGTIIGRSTATTTNVINVNFGEDAGEINQIYYWVDKTYASGAQVYKKLYNSVLPRSIMTVKSGSATFQGVTIETATKTEDNVDKMVLLGGLNHGKLLAFNRYDAKIYGFQIYEGDELIMDLIPAKSLETNKVGLYDRVSRELFISNGPSDFIYE